MCEKHSWVEWMITSQMYKTEFLSMTNRQITIHLRVLDRGRKLQFPTYSGISFMSLTLIALGVSTRTIDAYGDFIQKCGRKIIIDGDNGGFCAACTPDH